ncbi:hypothetical protein [Cyanobium sp. WAJ14-Wanaka]|uniref:hypothetical protein n=1 Tax=Cyanobium sp. WAJ14-Wanaka TaxID=2823725 RepID=UPI0020CC591A|nr:hypothetical protein [Cyanobium sp. WAJ14-Wanaka]MCP9774312.1 hypothetical protein [Cyanobium sp. WAJ14-Wanaka]
MDCRRLVVWIATGILGFQGISLAVGLVHCWSFASWHVQRHGPMQQALQLCDPLQQRIDDAVSHGIGLLAVLAVGGVVGALTPGRSDQP